MRRGIDLDGVIVNFHLTMQNFVTQHFGHPLDWSRYDMGLSLEQYRDIYDLMVDDGQMLHAHPYEGAVGWIATCPDEIVYITRRRPGRPHTTREYLLRAHTKLWLLRSGILREVVFTQDKVKACQEHGIDVMTEDYLPDAIKIDRVCPCYLINRPWNQGDYPRRVNSLNDTGHIAPLR